MRLFRYIAQFFGESVYCEDCIHCVPQEEDTIFPSGPICKAHPMTVDRSEKDDFVKRGREINIVKTYKPCKEVRLIKTMPLSYMPTCWKFDKKPLQSEKNVV